MIYFIYHLSFQEEEDLDVNEKRRSKNLKAMADSSEEDEEGMFLCLSAHCY